MTLPTTGSAISLNQVNVELALTGTTSIQMNQTTVRTLFAKPTSASVIAMSDGHGKSNGPPAITSIVISGPTAASYIDYANTWTVLITYSNGTTSTDCTLLSWAIYSDYPAVGTLRTRPYTLTAASYISSPGPAQNVGYVKATHVASGVSGTLNITWTCLPLPTLITMTDNTQQQMGNIKVGDMVKAIDPETHEISNEKVTFVLDTNTSYDLINIECEDNIILAPTPEHEVWINRNGITQWVESKDITINDKLLADDLTYKKVLSVTHINYPEGIQVGNISVANAKVYFAERLLMHNTGL